MKSIYQVILEGESATKFDAYTSSFDELLKLNDTLRANAPGYEFLKEFFNDVIELANYKPEELFIYAHGATYFKIPYAFGSAIKQCIGEKYSSMLKFTESGNKIKIYPFKGRGELFETGSGSIGRVSTEHQETATCIVWNAYVDAMIENKQFDLQNTEFIKNLVSDLTSDFDSEWILTFQKQVICLVEYFKYIGVDPLNYKLFRYGDKSTIGKAYQKYIKSYIKIVKGLKDNFDPADVIAYERDSESQIASTLNSYCQNPVESKKKYITDLFNKHLIKGLSLKKISGPKAARYDIYNIGCVNKCEKVNRFDYVKKANSITVKCWGNFNFDNITDGDGEIVGTEKYVELTMRSFGSGQTALDCALKETSKKNSPTLGKCPARFWREELDCEEGFNLHQNIDQFEIILKKTADNAMRGKLETLIKGAIKEGPLCFPFVLIH